MSDKRPFDPKTTTFTNLALDEIMPKVSPNAWKVLCVAIRKTEGWQDEESPTGRKQSDVISVSQFMLATGITNRNTTMDAISECLTCGYLKREADGQSWRYRLNLKYTIPEGDQPAQKLNRREIRASSKSELVDGETSSESELVPAQILSSQTLRNPKEETNTKKSAAAKSAAAVLPAPSEDLPFSDPPEEEVPKRPPPESVQRILARGRQMQTERLLHIEAYCRATGDRVAAYVGEKLTKARQRIVASLCDAERDGITPEDLETLLRWRLGDPDWKTFGADTDLARILSMYSSWVQRGKPPVWREEAWKQKGRHAVKTRGATPEEVQAEIVRLRAKGYRIGTDEPPNSAGGG